LKVDSQSDDILIERKITAILAADVAGYSKLVATDEENTIKRLASYRVIFDALIAKYGGRIFNTAGDAVMAEFPSAVEAVRCAVDVQESLRTRNRDLPPERQMHFRIGLSIGDVIKRGDDLLGDGVNIAARLEGLAKPGGICVSRSIYEQVSNKVSIPFSDIGAQTVKNIPTPVHAYMVSDGSAGLAARTIATIPAAPHGFGRLVSLLTAAGIVGLVAGSGWFVLRPAGPPPPAGGATALARVVYEGTISCERLPWSGPFVGTAVLVVANGAAEFSRPIFTLDGARQVGAERGLGKVASDGAAEISASFFGPNTGTRIDSTYYGRIDQDIVTLTGKQNHVYRDQRFEGRNCTITLRKKLN
jgi:class 3 adenylate cyclase